MDGFTTSIYLSEVATQCGFARGAVAQLNWALRQIGAPPGRTPEDLERRRFAHGEVFRALHSLLSHASNVSRLLWPTHGRGATGQARSERAAELRERLVLPADSHPLKSRRLRDHLEHFDERLDHWRDSSPHHNFAQDNIGPRGMIGGIDPNDVMRSYDPGAKTYIFRGESFDIQEIVAALERLLPVAETASEEARRSRGHA